MNEHVWKLQDAKARLSELIRRARTGEVQRVTLHGRDAVVILDPTRYEFKEKAEPKTLAGFFERSRRYAVPDDVEFERPFLVEFRELFSFDEPPARRRKRPRRARS